MKVQVSSFPKSYSEDFWRIPKYSKSAPKVWHFRVKHHKWSWWKFCRRDMIYIALESSLRALSDAIERRGGQLFRFHVYFWTYHLMIGHLIINSYSVVTGYSAEFVKSYCKTVGTPLCLSDTDNPSDLLSLALSVSRPISVLCLTYCREANQSHCGAAALRARFEFSSQKFSTPKRSVVL